MKWESFSRSQIWYARNNNTNKNNSNKKNNFGGHLGTRSGVQNVISLQLQANQCETDINFHYSLTGLPWNDVLIDIFIYMSSASPSSVPDPAGWLLYPDLHGSAPAPSPVLNLSLQTRHWASGRVKVYLHEQSEPEWHLMPNTHHILIILCQKYFISCFLQMVAAAILNIEAGL